MKTYLRILTHAGPIWRLCLLYTLTTLLAIFFGLVNLSLLTPLLEVLFSQPDGGGSLAATIAKPSFSISLTHLKELFSYHFIDIIAKHGRISALYFVCIVMIISVLLANLFRYLAEIMAAELRVNVIHNLRRALFDKILRLHMGYFTNQHKGDIMARIMNDVQEVEHAMEYSFRIFFKEPATITGFFVVLFYISPQLTWLALLALPTVGGGIIAIVKRLLQRAAQSQASLSRLTSILEEAMGGMHMIKTFSIRSYIATKFERENRTYAKINLSMYLKTSLIPLLSAFLGVLVLTLLLAYGGQLVLSDETTFTASIFITYIIIFSQALVPIKSISKSLSNIQRGLAAGKRIFSLTDIQPAIVNKPGARTIKSLEKAITFKEVRFVYDHQPIIKLLSLTIEAKKKIAIVGPSGGGKSTISSLISRLYDVTQGVIQVDGLPLQDYDIRSLRRLIGIVTQETMLFHDTVFNNIALGRPEASIPAVIEAARIAHVHELIQTLPQGYQTVIGAGESKLSSGQKQQIGIARGVLNKPSVLVLDEATSALDSTSAKLVQEAIDTLMQDKTLLVIAHRLSTIRNADKIFVIDGGEVAEHGTHEVLMRQGGLYKQLVRS